ncbi:ATP-binding protein [Streptomyces triculaminicus]|uniref:ATP-binding protein n=1 Tax=Streptomyces triculaminicus TaxID=2816232 RepID=UPI0037D239E6
MTVITRARVHSDALPSWQLEAPGAGMAPALRKRPRMRVRRVEVMGVALSLEAVRAGRHAVSKVLSRWGVGSEEVFRVELIVSELLTNAFQHALPGPGGKIGLLLAQDCGGVLIEVEDGGSKCSEAVVARPAGSEDDDESEHGRGLLLVEELGGGCWGRRQLGAAHHAVWAYVAAGESRGAR